MRVVIIDPDEMNGKLLQYALNLVGHKDVALVREPFAAIALATGQETDAVVLDSALPGVHAWDICKELRGRRYAGAIMVMAEEATTQDKLRCFANGADDFLVEPFAPRELIARLDAEVRRCKQADLQAMGTVLKVGDAELSVGQLTYQVGNEPSVRLTPTEMRILECLMRNSAVAINRTTLIERAWESDDLHYTNRVEVYIRRLREKIEQDPSNPRYLHTVRGIGYMFRPPSLEPGRLHPTSGGSPRSAMGFAF